MAAGATGQTGPPKGLRKLGLGFNPNPKDTWSRVDGQVAAAERGARFRWGRPRLRCGHLQHAQHQVPIGIESARKM